MTSLQVKRLRARLGLTQEKFAALVYADRVTVARWETGASSPRGLYLKVLRELEEKVKRKAKGKLSRSKRR